MAEIHEHQCKHLLGYLSEYIDGDLPSDLCKVIQDHIKTCEKCRIVVDTLRKTVELYDHCAESPCDLPDEVRERLFLKLDLNSFIDE